MGNFSSARRRLTLVSPYFTQTTLMSAEMNTLYIHVMTNFPVYDVNVTYVTESGQRLDGLVTLVLIVGLFETVH